MYVKSAKLFNSRLERAGRFYKQFGDSYSEWEAKNRIFLDGLDKLKLPVKRNEARRQDVAAGTSFHKRLSYYITVIEQMAAETFQYESFVTYL